MAGNRLIDKIRKSINRADKNSRRPSYLRRLVSGSFFRVSDLKGNTDIATIKAKIDMMRALATDSQISTALSYYATDATTTNTAGQIIWATSKNPEVAELINDLFTRWKVNRYARDHILELGTQGNFYMATTEMYRELSEPRISRGVALDNNTVPDTDYDLVPSHMVPPEDILHIWKDGQPQGYVYQPDDDPNVQVIRFPESGIIHFSLGGCLGKYTIDARLTDGSEGTYDIQFAEPLLADAVNPTQTLNLLEDAMLLASFVRVVKFVSVDCRDAEEDEIEDQLQQVKDAIEQQLSINTSTGDAQSYLNPQAPNNLIYLAKVDGSDPISITDLNMTEATDAENKMLDHFENKKLSVLGVPKEALNYSSNEGLGGAGTVMSQRSALYANILERIMTAYQEGWRQGLNCYFTARGMSGFVDQFELHMNPIITTQSTVQFDKRDAALNQATMFVQLLKDCGVTDPKVAQAGLTEILSEVFPQMGADAAGWDIDTAGGDNGGIE